MTAEQVLDALKAAIADETGSPVPELSPENTAEDVPGWDSLAHVRIIMNLEARLGVQIDMDRTYRAETIGSLMALALPAA